MDVPRLVALQKSWDIVPPAAMTLTAIASGLGVKMTKRSKKPPPSVQDAKAFAKTFGKF